MTRLWNSKDATDGGGSPAGAWAPGSLDAAPGLIEVDNQPPEHYVARPMRPAAQLAARIGLWSAVVLGCVGGIVGAVRPTTRAVEPVVEQAGGDELVPAPVAGVAELAVGEWLTATDDDEERLDALFVESVSTRDVDTERLSVGKLTTVAGRQVDEGYWAVTVAADVIELDVSGVVGEAGEAPASTTTTWYVEVGIVGEVDGGLAALTTPAVLPAPAAVADDWHQGEASGLTPDANDPVVATVQGFLAALLTGEGDPSRYLSPGETIAAADPAPFVDLLVLEMAITDVDDTRARAWTQVQVTTPGGSRQVVAYEVLVAQRVDRWEVVELSGVPTSIEGPPSGRSSPRGSTPDTTAEDPPVTTADVSPAAGSGTASDAPEIR